jgi:hypothetical protein
MCKAFGLTPDYVLHKISYANLTLLSATLPDYSDNKETADAKTPNTVNGDDPQSWGKIQNIADRINNRK